MESNTIKYIKSLHQKKFRVLENRFLVEGCKMVNELLDSNFKVEKIYTTHEDLFLGAGVEIEQISEKELGRISSLKKPNKVLAVVEVPDRSNLPQELDNQLSLIVENVQDPGNMGTILRIANWYGIQNIFCSEDSVECYNPKVVQATMGALFRVKTYYTNIYQLIEKASEWNHFGVYGMHLNGNNIYDEELEHNGFIILGNESKGLSEKVFTWAVKKIKLPSYPANSQVMESLNVAVAAAVTVAEFRRRNF